MSTFSYLHKKKNKRCGFTVIELMVSTSILVIITSVILVNQSTFGENTLVRSLAYNIGLSIRQAQVFGLSVREFGIGTDLFDIGYGVHFDNSSDPPTYIIFADKNKDGIYRSSDDGIEEVFSIGRGFKISQICVTPASSSETCSIQTLDITFIRPNPDALIRAGGDFGTIYQSARIVVQSPRGRESEIVVQSTGQISIAQVTSQASQTSW